MKSFFKIFLASFTALLIFTIFGIIILFVWVGSLATPEKVVIKAKSVLVVDLSRDYQEISVENPVAALTGNNENDAPALHDVLRLISKAKNDASISGIYLQCNSNINGFAASEEIRAALADFKKSGKFIMAYGDVISQKGYYVGNVADKIYCNPKGGLSWQGFSVTFSFMKGLLAKLDIKPQIFYDGKFKSATEPLREEKMTDANKLQTSEWLGDLYGSFLVKAGEARKIDTALLRQYAVNASIQTARDALKYNLVDGLKYDDEVKDEIKTRLGIAKDEKINWVTLGTYAEAVSYKNTGTGNKIAIIYAEGDMVYGKGEDGEIGSDEYKAIIRKARMNKDVKAIVLRINTGGGSSLASDIIWRELEMARRDGKPVVVSMGDIAASGGYYMACAADSIFAMPGTLTGSIGVFGIIPNMEDFFKNKMGITFDGVKTAPNADMGSVTRPLTDIEKKMIQAEVDTTYYDFKKLVSNNRKRSIEYIDSIAQGRVWTGQKALNIGLVDRLGGLSDAIACAARMAKLKDYKLKEFPEPVNMWDKLLGNYSKYSGSNAAIRSSIGEDDYKIYMQIKQIRQMVGTVQARLPYEFDIR
jgi:protease IV